MMLRQLRIDRILHKKSFLTILLIQLGAALFGMAMTAVIMTVDDNPGTWFCLGTLICMMVLGAAVLFFYGFSYSSEFRLALSMGCTRRVFMASYLLRILCQLAVGYALILLFHKVELRCYPVWFHGFENDLYFGFLTDCRMLLGVFVGAPLLSMLIGSLHARFGQKSLLLFYFLWMFCCLVLPRMFHVTAADTGVLNRTAYLVLTAFTAIPTGPRIAILAVLPIAAAAAILRIGSRMMVR